MNFSMLQHQRKHTKTYVNVRFMREKKYSSLIEKLFPYDRNLLSIK